MRVLVVLSKLPVLEGPAATRTNIALLRGLRAHGVDVRVLAPRWWNTVEGEVPGDLDVEAFALHDDRDEPSKADRLRRGMPLLAGRYADRVRELATSVDVVHFEEVEAAVGARGLRTPHVAHLHCDARRDRDVGLSLSRAARDTIQLLRAERDVRRHAPHLLVNSDELARDVPRRAGQDVTVAPLALDPADYPLRAGLASQDAGLIGSARWPPTANAVRMLLTEVWPRVVAERPDARLHLAGHDMQPGTFPDLPSPPGVTWHGRVDSAERFLAGLGLMLYPLERGSGTKVKVLEALALGLPVVTTTSGAEGIGAPREGLAVCADPAQLAAATLRLMGDPELRRTEGARARQTFAIHHTPLAATRPVVALHERLAAGA